MLPIEIVVSVYIYMITILDVPHYKCCKLDIRMGTPLSSTFRSVGWYYFLFRITAGRKKICLS